MEEYRFVATGFPSESAEDYRPGGFHPVHIDDGLKDGRYRVVRKLGNGVYSTVWLAFDGRTTKYVAVKILRAGDSARDSKEISICDFLAEKSTARHVVALLDSFQLIGPNGLHTCLVFEPIGPSAAPLVEDLPCNQPHTLGQPIRYSKAMAKMIIKQLLSALAFIHEHGITHGDLHPENILFSISDLSEKNLRQDPGTISEPLRRLDGRSDPLAPKYLALGQSLREFLDLGPSATVKLSDFGSALWTKDPSQSTVTPVALPAPELIFKQPFDSVIDIWAFGCLVYEFITGTRLFSVDLIGDDEHKDADDDHILDLTDVLGPLPDDLMSRWERQDKRIGPDGERLQPRGQDGDAESSQECDSPRADPSDTDELADPEPLKKDTEFDDELDAGMVDSEDEAEDLPAEPFINDSLEVQFNRNKPDDVNDEEAKVITTIIRQILQYETSKRPTAEQLLGHEWLRS